MGSGSMFRFGLDLHRRPLDGPSEVTKFSAAPAEVARVAKDAGITYPDGSQHLVVGVVLEPTKEMGQPDTQGDVYSADEIRQAEATWRSEFRAIGLQHSADISDRVEVVQSWITPVDCTIGTGTAVAGSWLLCVRCLDDALWAACRDGSISGFSIGGTANRQPVS